MKILKTELWEKPINEAGASVNKEVAAQVFQQGYWQVEDPVYWLVHFQVIDPVRWQVYLQVEGEIL